MAQRMLFKTIFACIGISPKFLRTKNMKSLYILAIICLFTPSLIFAQLTIETVSGKKHKKNISLQTKIGLIMPTQTANNDCNCCHLTYTGRLDSTDADYATLNLLESNRTFVDERGLNQFQNTRFEKNALVPTNVPLNSLKGVSVYPKSREAMKRTGYILLILTTAQAFAINPILNGKSRRAGTAIAITGFTTGLVLSMLPDKKTYYFEQPAGEPRQLWRLGR